MTSSGRKYPRTSLSGAIKCFDWNRPFQAQPAEISAGGIFLRTAAVLPEGSLITLRLRIPGERHAFTVLGRVVRTVLGSALRPAGMGVRFVDIAAGDRRAVAEYVSRRTLMAA